MKAPKVRLKKPQLPGHAARCYSIRIGFGSLLSAELRAASATARAAPSSFRDRSIRFVA
jgi:hypothetical protein